MREVPIYYTEFKTPQSVEFSESDLILLHSANPKSKTLILNARRVELWKQFRQRFPVIYYLAKSLKWGAVVFLLLSGVVFVTKPFVDAPAVAASLLTISIMCGAVRFSGIGWNLTYSSHKRFVKTHIKLLKDKVEGVRPEWR